MSAEPFSVSHNLFKVGRKGFAVLESMIFPFPLDHEGPNHRAARLTIRTADAQYAVYAANMNLRAARELASLLPLPRGDLNGLKLTAGHDGMRSWGDPFVVAGEVPSRDWVLQVDDPGDAAVQVGDIFTPDGLDRLTPSKHPHAQIEDHVAREFYRLRAAEREAKFTL
ncbi:hypothetical protein [Mesorhizobium sp. B2-4-6]|uniref:hypothetical protein n=1 Tax=Mesorhizobium sp. B2-4-6 TaxID=2589943 RepID=UPI00112BE301|nr:hypothetical protein [Mesorhizobium sp. B2-4-6]TPL51521.1 hypothetical protein FJ957_07995 [Mesorhizobium sp. B2-4-6]